MPEGLEAFLPICGVIKKPLNNSPGQVDPVQNAREPERRRPRVLALPL